MTEGETAFFASRGFGNVIGFGQRPAVVVVDVINAFTDPTMPLGADLSPQVEAIRDVLPLARAAEIPVLFTSVAYEQEDLRDAGVWALKQTGVMSLRSGTPAVDVDDRLRRRSDEPLIVKKFASAFFGTDLASRLTSRAVDTVIITGCTTSGCVRATAVDALQHGFRPMVVREAVGDRSADAHRQSLFDLEQKYADVVALDAVLEYLEKLVVSG